MKSVWKILFDFIGIFFWEISFYLKILIINLIVNLIVQLLKYLSDVGFTSCKVMWIIFACSYSDFVNKLENEPQVGHLWLRLRRFKIEIQSFL